MRRFDGLVLIAYLGWLVMSFAGFCLVFVCFVCL